AGEMITRELNRNVGLGMHPVAFVDDDPTKQRHKLAGLPIAGTLADIPAVVSKMAISQIIIAMPTAPGAVVRSVIKAANDAGIKTRIIPALSEILSEKVSVSSIRDVRIDDLLRREPIQTDLGKVASLAEGTVLVTGAGGSIGA